MKQLRQTPVSEEQPSSEKPKKKMPIVLIMIVTLNVLLGGGAATFFFLRNGGVEASSKGEQGEAEGSGESAVHTKAEDHGNNTTLHTTLEKQGPLITFPAMVVNLNEPEGARYLKIELAVQLANDKLVEAIEKAKPIVQDAFIRDLSDLNFRQTMGGKSKIAIKRRLIKRFNESLGTDAALDIHIMQFIVQ